MYHFPPPSSLSRRSHLPSQNGARGSAGGQGWGWRRSPEQTGDVETPSAVGNSMQEGCCGQEGLGSTCLPAGRESGDFCFHPDHEVQIY